ncbi:hypothetical protein [Streptomyces sp. NPDC055140]
MTTAVNPPRTVATARIDVPQPPTAPPCSDHTVTVYLNPPPRPFPGFRSGHVITQAAVEGEPVRLVFHATDATDASDASDARDEVAGAAGAAFCVSNLGLRDDHGQFWPSSLRPIAVGDVLIITTPSGNAVFVTVAPEGFDLMQ